MTKLSESELLELLPENLRNDPDMIAASQASDVKFQELYKKVSSVLTFSGMDQAQENIIDHLAYEMGTDFYDTSLDLETKRELVKDAYIYKFLKGTPYAVERLVNTIFGDGEVTEWFDYDGEPYHFKVETSNEEATNEKAKQFIRAIDAVKNCRSVLDEVALTTSDNMPIYYGFVVEVGDNMIIRQVN